MLRRNPIRILLVLAALLCIAPRIFAQDPIEHEWYNEAKTGKVKIYLAKDGLYYGRISWLKEPDRNGKPKTDYMNPDDARKNDPELGLMVLKGFKKDGASEYNGGTIYDPKNGRTYHCIITREGDELHVRGYIGFSLIGRTETWTRGDK